MIKFKDVVIEVFGYEYHDTQNASDYVRENGLHTFEAEQDGKKIEVKLETGCDFYHNDYNAPSAEYEISEILVDGAEADIDEFDQNLQDAINDLRLQTRYESDPEGYFFNLHGRGEENFGEEVKRATYEEMRKLINKEYIVVSAETA